MPTLIGGSGSSNIRPSRRLLPILGVGLVTAGLLWPALRPHREVLHSDSQREIAAGSRPLHEPLSDSQAQRARDLTQEAQRIPPTSTTQPVPITAESDVGGQTTRQVLEQVARDQNHDGMQGIPTSLPIGSILGSVDGNSTYRIEYGGHSGAAMITRIGREGVTLSFQNVEVIIPFGTSFNIIRQWDINRGIPPPASEVQPIVQEEGEEQRLLYMGAPTSGIIIVPAEFRQSPSVDGILEVDAVLVSVNVEGITRNVSEQTSVIRRLPQEQQTHWSINEHDQEDTQGNWQNDPNQENPQNESTPETDNQEPGT